MRDKIKQEAAVVVPHRQQPRAGRGEPTTVGGDNRYQNPEGLNAMDAFLIASHGCTITHLDAPSHTFFRTDPAEPWTMYNGMPRESVTTTLGATAGAVDLAGGGIVSRGVLLDIARLRGVDWLEPDAPVFPEDLDACRGPRPATCGR